uniref:Mechanosensitive ion channel n=1 Tax=Desulfobacca acetoxidans TaxID=60893 RepID=A0A7C3YX45_9BACT
MVMRWRRLFLISSAAALGLLFSLTVAAQESKTLAPESLPKVLAEGAKVLEKDIAAGKAEAEALQQQIKQAEGSLQNLGAQIATLKASQGAGELQLKQAQEALETFTRREAAVAAKIKQAEDMREQFSKQLSTRTNAFAGLKQEVERLKAAKHPLWKSPKFRSDWERYEQLAKQYKTGATQTLERFDELLRITGEERQSLAGVLAELTDYVETGKKEELLKRRTLGFLWETVKQTWKSLLEMPGRLAQDLSEPRLGPKVAATLRTKWAPLLGLLAVFFLLAWSAVHLRRSLLPKLALWESEVTGLGTKIIFEAGEIIVAHLFALSFVAWLALTEWVLGWWQTAVARILLLGLFVWVGLRLGLRLIQAVFAGQDQKGILPLDDRTARFYCRHFKLLLTYILVLGLFGLGLLERLGLEPDSYQILGLAFGVGLLVWVLYLLRSRHFDDLRTELPGPEWLKRRGFFLTVRVLLLAVLAAIILASLLGFQNLSAYIAQAASLFGLLLVLFWVTWQGVRGALEHALEREKGRVSKKIRQKEVVLRNYFLAIMKVVVAFLVAGALLIILNIWGVDLGFLSWLSLILNWGTNLGPFHLTLLGLGSAALALYLGRWSSRFLRILLEVRFYPRRDWDQSIRYTIANTLHYFIQAVAILMALSLLGISFSDLAIVAGGLGVGIGFGLQNIVNNFFSGLILLFERPIKVGDMLVIDGQWGQVKEIRVRSTIFQTFDRSVLIIPNSDLISSKIVNWTHYGPGINRLTLKVGVSYGSDVRRVTMILDEVCRANPRVVSEPPPQIFFEAYGDSSLNFNIWVFLATPSDRIPATHELNTAIFEAFQEAGIEVPFPQRDLHIKNWPDLSALAPSAGKAEA